VNVTVCLHVCSEGDWICALDDVLEISLREMTNWNPNHALWFRTTESNFTRTGTYKVKIYLEPVDVGIIWPVEDAGVAKSIQSRSYGMMVVINRQNLNR